MAKRTFKQKRLTLEHQVSVWKQRIASTEDKLARQQLRLKKLDDDYKRLLASHDAVLGPHTSRNRRLYAVLEVVQARLSEPDAREGLRSSELYAAVTKEGFRIVPVTFRGYLRRYQDKVLRRASGSWHLVDTSASSAPLTQWEVSVD